MVAQTYLWLIDGWTFIAIYIGLVMIYCVDVAYRWTRPIPAFRGRDAFPIGRYERAMLTAPAAGSAGTAQWLALVALLERDVLQEGKRWNVRRGFGEPRFAFARGAGELRPDADPVERDVRDVALAQTHPIPIGKLQRRLSSGPAITQMRRRLVDGGLLYPECPEAKSLACFGLMMLGWVSAGIGIAHAGAHSGTDTTAAVLVGLLAPFVLLAIYPPRGQPTAAADALALTPEAYEPAGVLDRARRNGRAIDDLAIADRDQFIGL
ncbi:MAG: hypothetical protein QOJ89_4706 [bacterium]